MEEDIILKHMPTRWLLSFASHRKDVKMLAYHKITDFKYETS